MAVHPQPQQTVQVQLTYLDRPEVSETFADLLRVAFVEGFNIKLEFTVNRPDIAQPGAPITGKVVTACRLVLPLPAVMDMVGKLGGLLANLQAQGVLMPIHQAPATVN